MTQSLSTDLFDPEILEDAIAGALPGAVALVGSPCAKINTSLPNAARGGDIVTVPYFGSLGRLAATAQGDALVPTKLTMSSETATVARAGLAFEMSVWAQFSAQFAHPYEEAKNQLMAALVDHMDRALIAAAAASLPSTMIKDVFSAAAPRGIDLDLIADGKAKWGDEMKDIVGFACHSRTWNDMKKLKDATGRPLIAEGVMKVDGMDALISDRNTITHTGTVITTSTTGTPAVVDITGTPLGVYDLRIQITTLGIRGTSKFKYSLDGGVTYNPLEITTAATVALDVADFETGLTATFAAGTSAVDHLYSSRPKFTTLLLKKDALVYWTSGNPSFEEWHSPLTATDVCALNVYDVAYRYARMPGLTRGGVVALKHNAASASF